MQRAVVRAEGELGPRSVEPIQGSLSKPCAATTLREWIGGTVINPFRRRLAMFSNRTNRARGRRARSAEDESPVIVGSIAILAVIVLSCVGMMAPVLWDAFAGGPGPHWSERSCSQESGAAVATNCPECARLQVFPPRPKPQIDPLIPHL
jgi:hypothetical protein